VPTYPGHAPWARATREATVLLLVAIAATTVLWVVRSDVPPLRADRAVYELELPAPVVTVATARDLYAEGRHLFVDTRPDAAERQNGIPGAFLIGGDDFADDLAANMDFIYPEDPLILYDDGTMQTAAATAARFLERGYEDLQILQGGLEAWRRAGGPVEGDRDEG